MESEGLFLAMSALPALSAHIWGEWRFVVFAGIGGALCLIVFLRIARFTRKPMPKEEFFGLLRRYCAARPQERIRWRQFADRTGHLIEQRLGG
jgi:hypothetical protein